jgi:hypothetical protein
MWRHVHVKEYRKKTEIDLGQIQSKYCVNVCDSA